MQVNRRCFILIILSQIVAVPLSLVLLGTDVELAAASGDHQAAGVYESVRPAPGPSWLRSTAKQMLPMPASKERERAAAVAVRYYSMWHRNDPVGLVRMYADEAALVHRRVRLKGRVYRNRSAAVLIMREYAKDNRKLVRQSLPRITQLNSITYGQAVALLSIVLSSDSIDALRSGRLDLRQRFLVYRVTIGGHDYLYMSLKDQNSWRALTQPYSLDMPAPLR